MDDSYWNYENVILETPELNEIDIADSDDEACLCKLVVMALKTAQETD